MLGSADAKENKFQKLANACSLHTYCTQGATLQCYCQLLVEYLEGISARNR